MSTSTSQGLSSRAERILREAARLFALNGYQGTTIDDIGDAAGISGPGVYRHFGSKQAILIELICRVNEEFEVRVSELFSKEFKDKNYDDALRHLVRLHVDEIMEYRMLAVAYWNELPYLVGEEAEKFASAERRYLDGWRFALSRLRPTMSPDRFEVVAEVIYWLMRSTVFYDGHLDPDQFSAMVACMCLATIDANVPQFHPVTTS